ncbi:CTP synthase C-terminal region-related (seleno)protein [Nitrospira sp. CMX1]
MPRLIAVLGEYTPSYGPHQATDAAIEHSKKFLGVDIGVEWISTQAIDERGLNDYSGLWIAPGSPYKSLEKTLRTIQYAREHRVPCLGTCGGFQHMLLEYVRNVLSLKDSGHAEYDPYASNLFISRLACSLAGREMELNLVAGSQVAAIYGATSVKEQYYCNFGVNPEYVPLLKQGPLNVSGSDAEGEVRAVEHPGHPFFVGTLFVPQHRSTRERPHPLVTAFLKAVLKRAETSVKDTVEH